MEKSYHSGRYAITIVLIIIIFICFWFFTKDKPVDISSPTPTIYSSKETNEPQIDFQIYCTEHPDQCDKG